MRKTTGALGSWRAAWSAPGGLHHLCGRALEAQHPLHLCGSLPLGPAPGHRERRRDAGGGEDTIARPFLEPTVQIETENVAARREPSQVAFRQGRVHGQTLTGGTRQEEGGEKGGDRTPAETHVTRPPSSSRRRTARRRSDRAARSGAGCACPTVSYSSGRPAMARSQSRGLGRGGADARRGHGLALVLGHLADLRGLGAEVLGGEALAAQTAREDDRAVDRRDQASDRPASGSPRRAMGSVDLDPVAVSEDAVEHEVAARRGKGLERAGRSSAAPAFCGPRGHAHAQRETLRLRRADDQAGHLLLREARLLGDGHAALRPVERRRHEQVDDRGPSSSWK